MENKKFKKKFIGGFDKGEVIDYIDKLQQQQAQEDEQKYIEQIELLKNERDALASALEQANEQIKKLSDPVKGSKSMIASSIAHSKSHFDSMVSLSEEVRSETAEKLAEVSNDVQEMLKSSVEMKKDFEAAAQKLGDDIEKLQSYLDKSSPFFRADRGALGDISAKAEDEDSSIKSVLEEGFKLLDETTAQEDEIDKILHDLKKKND